MIPKIQTRIHVGDSPKERGNCFPAVIASILEVEVEDVIQIQEHYDDPDWTVKLLYWLLKMGYDYRSADEFKCFHDEFASSMTKAEILEKTNHCSGKYYLVTGMSERGKQHVVIYKDGKMVHDPHPDGTGLVTIENFTVLEPI